MRWMMGTYRKTDSGVFTLFAGDLVMHMRPAPFLGSTAAILDLWEMGGGADLVYGGRLSELPPGFDLSNESTDPANFWRVRAGDRIVLIGERPGLAEGMIWSVLDFQDSALVHWRYDEDDLPSPLEAMGQTAVTGAPKRTEWAKLAVAKVSAMRLPSVLQQFDIDKY